MQERGHLDVTLMKALELICTIKMLCRQELTWGIVVGSLGTELLGHDLYFFSLKNSEFHSGVEMRLKISEILL